MITFSMQPDLTVNIQVDFPLPQQHINELLKVDRQHQDKISEIEEQRNVDLQLLKEDWDRACAENPKDLPKYPWDKNQEVNDTCDQMLADTEEEFRSLRVRALVGAMYNCLCLELKDEALKTARGEISGIQEDLEKAVTYIKADPDYDLKGEFVHEDTEETKPTEEDLELDRQEELRNKEAEEEIP